MKTLYLILVSLGIMGIAYATLPETLTSQRIPIGYNVDMQEDKYIFNTGIINYVDSEDKWKKSNPVFKVDGDEMIIDEVPYELRVPKKANQKMRFVSTNKYSIKERRIRYDLPVGTNKWFDDAASVDGKLTSEGYLYANAFDYGDLLIAPHEEHVKFLVKINTLPVVCSDSGAILEVNFRQQFDRGLKPKKKDGMEIGNKDEILKGYKAGVNDFRGIGVRQAYAWDSDNRIDIDIVGKYSGQNLLAKKVIPCSFLINATLPAYTDASFYPDPNVETVTFDGNLMRTIDGGESWSTMINNTVATYYVDSLTTSEATRIVSKSATTWKRSARGIFLFDISSLAGQTISAGTFKFTPSGTITDNFSESVVLVSSDPASNTGIAAGDYDSFGTTRYATDITLASLTQNVESSLTLNAAGLSFAQTALDGDGIVKLGMRLAADVDNNEPDAGGDNEKSDFAMYFADQTGTDKDPELEITAAIAVSASPKSAIWFD